MKRRVVITGLGAVTPIGNTVEEFWNGVRKGACGIGTITKFDTAEYKVHLAGTRRGERNYAGRRGRLFGTDRTFRVGRSAAGFDSI